MDAAPEAESDSDSAVQVDVHEMSQDPILPGETPTTERAKRPQPKARDWRLRGESSVSLGESKLVDKDPVKRVLFNDHDPPQDSNHDAVSKDGEPMKEVEHPEGEEEEVKEDDPCEDTMEDVTGVHKDSSVYEYIYVCIVCLYSIQIPCFG